MDIPALKHEANSIRKSVWQLIYDSKTGHTGSDFSCTDILTALYFDILKQDPQSFANGQCDHYIQSKGHAVEVLYATLAQRGYFPKSDLKNFSGFKTHYIGHPNNQVNGIEMNTGSLGHGLALGVGIALANQIDHTPYHTFVLMGDGEQAEGSIWEAAMAASQYHLDHLTAIVDHNHLQISGPTTQVMKTDSLADKYQAFGWDVVSCDGNNIEALVEALQTPNNSGKPRMLLANTIKGCGISFMENKAEWHHKVPTEAQFIEGMHELDLHEEDLL